MDLNTFHEKRKLLNEKLVNSDNFFGAFGSLDEEVYSEGAIPKKYKELTGLSISIFSKCEECIAYHMQNCIEQGCSKMKLWRRLKLQLLEEVR